VAALQIQRVPRALSDLLSIFGGQTPQMLSDENHGIVDLLQFYGLNQQQFLNATDAALAIGGNATLTVPSNQYWLLFGAHAVATIPAAATAIRLNVNAGNGSSFVALATDQLTAGVVAGQDFRVPIVMPYPRLLLPNYSIRAQLEHLAGAATASVGITAQVGVLG
jgi:hypothetical protein